MAEAPDEYQAQGIRSFIDAIDARRPFTFSAYVSVAPSTNVNNGSSNKTIYSPLFGADLDIDDESREQSGVGFSTGLSAGYSHRLGNDFSVVLGGGINATIYTTATTTALKPANRPKCATPDRWVPGAGLGASENMKMTSLA